MSQKTDTMIKLALVFFVSLLSFSVGTYVGKKYSDNQHKLALLEPKTDHAGVNTKSEEFASDVAAETDHTTKVTDEVMVANDAKPTALTDSEVAKIAEEFATDEGTTDEKIVGSVDAEEKTVGSVDAEEKILESIADSSLTNQAPVKVNTATATATPKAAKAASEVTSHAPVVEKTKQLAEEERVPASIPAKKEEITPMHFTVQVGSFPTQDEAEKMTKELQTKGYKTTFVPAKVNGQLWYRVNVGLFGTIKEAQDYKKEFLEKTKVSSAIVQRVQK
jgi:cell division protein FtsN